MGPVTPAPGRTPTKPVRPEDTKGRDRFQP
jgi:hypothetical protein